MGSRPTKTSKENGAYETPNNETKIEQFAEEPSEGENSTGDDDDGDDGVPAISKKIRKNTDFKEISERVMASMDFLNSAKDFTEKGILSILIRISNVYYVLQRPRRDDLKAICDILLDRGILRIFTRMWDLFHEDKDDLYGNIKGIKFRNFKKIKKIFWNYSDKCPELANACYENGEVIQRLMTELTMPELAVENLRLASRRNMIKATFGILINVVRHCNKNKHHIRKNDGIEKLLEYVKSTFLIIKADAYIILAYCINEDENHKITTGEGVIKFMVKLLSSALSSANHVAKTYSFSAEETIAALNRLAKSDDNKKQIVEAGILPLLTKCLEDDKKSNEYEHYEAVNCIWTLAFHPDNREKIIDEPGLINAIKRIENLSGTDAQEKLNKACSSALFVLGIEEIHAETEGERLAPKRKHVMISYNWEVQKTMLKLCDILKQNDFEVWIDVDNMQESILEAMADAVENSAIVLVAMTESYKNSNPCRTEAEYAYKRNVPILPLLLQSGYVADGWLGAIVGTKLYVDLSSRFFEEKFDDVKRQITNIVGSENFVNNGKKPGKITTATPISSSRLPGESYGMSVIESNVPCSNWTKEDVQEWYKSISVEDVKVLPKLDGASLSQMCKMLVRSPDTYYRILREDMHFSIQDMLSFTAAIESLLLRDS